MTDRAGEAGEAGETDDARGEEGGGAGDWSARLGEALAAAGPHRVALIGERAARLGGADAARLVGEGRVTRFASIADCAGAPFGERVADVALLTLDAAPDGGRDRALGTACRLYPARLLLFVEPDGPGGAPAPEALFAFGFRRLLVRPDGALHEYRLRDYKLPPDWLNARFWANPERFSLDEEEGDELDDTDAEDDADDDDEEDEDEGYEGREK